MERLHVNRTDKFKWNTRQELYDYFTSKFGLERAAIDSEISSVVEIFALRRGEPVKPQELWQRVGKSIEHRLTGADYRIKRDEKSCPVSDIPYDFQI